MSLAIDIDRVSAVLLADGWHSVHERSFDIDSYEFVQGDHLRLAGGQSALVCATGFAFTEYRGQGNIVTVAGPITSILAVRRDND